MRRGLVERECRLAAFGLWEADALCMKTSAGSLERALNFHTCSKVRLRCRVMNIETALCERIGGMRSRCVGFCYLMIKPQNRNRVALRDGRMLCFVMLHEQG